jgi:hypothetical protein
VAVRKAGVAIGWGGKKWSTELLVPYLQFSTHFSSFLYFTLGFASTTTVLFWFRVFLVFCEAMQASLVNMYVQWLYFASYR